MLNREYPRLCGGTFYVLTLEARRMRTKARQRIEGESDGLTDTDVLYGLLQVINSNCEKPQAPLSSMTSNYKACKISTSLYLPFDDSAIMNAFDNRVKTRYAEALIPMTAFVSDFLDTDPEIGKDVRLVKALIDLVQQDASIENDDVFYINENGEGVTKASFNDIKEVCLPAFLLGIWHYAVIERPDNTVGQVTYDKWCPETGGGARIYKGAMGESIAREITISIPITSKNESESSSNTEEEDGQSEQTFEDSDDHAEDTDKSSDEYDESSKKNQGVNKTINIQQNGDNNTVIPNNGTINIINKH